MLLQSKESIRLYSWYTPLWKHKLEVNRVRTKYQNN